MPSRGLDSRHRSRLALRALTIIRERYADFGPTLAREKLDECHGIPRRHAPALPREQIVRRLARSCGHRIFSTASGCQVPV